MDKLPIYFCVVRQEPIMNGQIGCTRILVCEKCTCNDIARLTRKYNLYSDNGMRLYGQNAMYMYFHREPEDLPFKELT